MTKYKVLKDFVSSDGGFIHKEGSEYQPTKSASRTANLERLGYIEEIPKQPKTVWDLKEGDTYWGIELFRLTGFCVMEYTFDLRAAHLREIGGVFLTEEECKKELARRKAKQILLRDTKGFKPDWSNERQYKYDVYYTHPHGELIVSQAKCISNHKDLWFRTKQEALDSIENHRDAWLTYFGVEE